MPSRKEPKSNTLPKSGQDRTKGRVSPEGVYALTAQIPLGRVSTYGAIASALGSGGSRAVGQILKRNPTPITVPCHRVVKSNGEVGGYAGAQGSGKKKRLLRQEGIAIEGNRVSNLDRVLFTAFGPVYGENATRNAVSKD